MASSSARAPTPRRPPPVEAAARGETPARAGTPARAATLPSPSRGSRTGREHERYAPGKLRDAKGAAPGVAPSHETVAWAGRGSAHEANSSGRGPVKSDGSPNDFIGIPNTRAT